MHLLAFTWSQWGLLIAQLLLSLSILVILHEFGHYITAKWFGCQVDKFYLFFDWPIALFKKKVGKTEYGIGVLPLGGYVKIAGMIDESMDKEGLETVPHHLQFRFKPAWQRLIIMLGGIIMNILTAIAIYAFVLMIWGHKTVPPSSLKYGIHFTDSTLIRNGFRTGDKLISVDGNLVKDFEAMGQDLLAGDVAVVEREGKQVTLKLEKALLGNIISNRKKGIPVYEFRVPTLVSAVSDTMGAAKAGIRRGDMIVALDSTPVQFFDELKAQLTAKKADSVLVTVVRNAETLQLKTKLSKTRTLGIGLYTDIRDMDSLGWAKYSVQKYGFFGAFPAAVGLTWDGLVSQAKGIAKIFNPATGGYKAIGGLPSMAKIFNPYQWDWELFWLRTALLSIALAIMNLLPIPALDGGHVVFNLWEMITGRKPSEKFLGVAQTVGMVFLLALMAYAQLNSLIGWSS